jgi:hypothetical protein
MGLKAPSNFPIGYTPLETCLKEWTQYFKQIHK